MHKIDALRVFLASLLIAALPLLGNVILSGPVDDGGSDKHEGFWGKKSATVNW